MMDFPAAQTEAADYITYYQPLAKLAEDPSSSTSGNEQKKNMPENSNNGAKNRFVLYSTSNPLDEKFHTSADFQPYIM
jgi:hypothetical protein